MENKKPEAEVGKVVGDQGSGRRRYSAEEKLRLLTESEARGSSISLVARKYGVSPSLVFRWRRLRDQGSLSGLKAGEAVVPQSEVQQLKAKIRELQRLLGKKWDFLCNRASETSSRDVLAQAMEISIA